MTQDFQIVPIEQGSPEWHALRKTKITATDANVIMGCSPWKDVKQLYNEKKSEETNEYRNERMQRGIDLEPIARDLFNLQTGKKMKPAVLVKDWAMASLDGYDKETGDILEIKCPGEKDHYTALCGKVPSHYYAQIQHQIYVAGTKIAYYYSFDGIEGFPVIVYRDDKYIEQMIAKEQKFYECLQTNIPPEMEDNYRERNDEEWRELAFDYQEIDSRIQELEKIKERIKNDLIFLCGELNSKGAGISLSKIERKGNVDYSRIPELEGINLDLYRKDPITSWRISCL